MSKEFSQEFYPQPASLTAEQIKNLALEKAKELTCEQIKFIAEILQVKIEPTLKAVMFQCEQEKEWLTAFLNKHQNFVHIAEGQLDYMLKQYGVKREERADINLVGRFTCALLEFNQGGGIPFISSMPACVGMYSPISDTAYLLVDEKFVEFDRIKFENTYLHEGGHAAGARKKEPYPHRGFNGAILEEGLVETLARRHVVAMNELSNQDIEAMRHKWEEQNYILNAYVDYFISLSRHIPEKLLFAAYFNSQDEPLKKEFKKIFGPDSFECLVLNKKSFPYDILMLCAENPDECREFLKVKAGATHLLKSEGLNRNILEKLLYFHFQTQLREDFTAFCGGEYGQIWTKEGQKEAEETLAKKYPERIVRIFFDILPYGSLFVAGNNQAILENYIRKKINGLWE
jgi:hypothetical protein